MALMLKDVDSMRMFGSYALEIMNRYQGFSEAFHNVCGLFSSQLMSSCILIKSDMKALFTFLLIRILAYSTGVIKNFYLY